MAAVREAAAVLGNTPTVARNSYIDPRVFDRFRSGQLIDRGRGRSRRRRSGCCWTPEEAPAVGHLLRSTAVVHRALERSVGIVVAPFARLLASAQWLASMNSPVACQRSQQPSTVLISLVESCPESSA